MHIVYYKDLYKPIYFRTVSNGVERRMHKALKGKPLKILTKEASKNHYSSANAVFFL